MIVNKNKCAIELLITNLFLLTGLALLMKKTPAQSNQAVWVTRSL
jgi:hypothetical protein